MSLTHGFPFYLSLSFNGASPLSDPLSCVSLHLFICFFLSFSPHFAMSLFLTVSQPVSPPSLPFGCPPPPPVCLSPSSFCLSLFVFLFLLVCLFLPGHLFLSLPVFVFFLFSRLCSVKALFVAHSCFPYLLSVPHSPFSPLLIICYVFSLCY